MERAFTEYNGPPTRSPQRTMLSRCWLIGWTLPLATIACGAGTVAPTGHRAPTAVALNRNDGTPTPATPVEAMPPMMEDESSDRTAAPLASSATAAAPPSSTAFARRCGWVDNPTPQNWWITDRDGEWEIGAQGGRQANGDLPDFDGSEWVRTNGYHGYGCACLEVRVDVPSRAILEIRSATVIPLARCRADRALPRR
jgi:hypothetical protein